MNEQAQLHDSLQRFRQWANSNDSASRSGEWEEDYEHWDQIFRSVRAVLRTPIESWCDETKQLLIYAIARNNETQMLVEELTNDQLLSLAELSSKSDEWPAKWQFAEQLGNRGEVNRRESVLLAYSADSDEYVRRIALMALANMGSQRTESLAMAAWETGEEYQRIAPLHALWRINSPLLARYLQLAIQDGRQYVVYRASLIQEKKGEYGTSET